MSHRKHLAGIAASAVAATVFAVAAPAGAATTTHDADDPAFDSTSTTVVTTGDLVGVGSDTSQHALHLIEGAWNAKSNGLRIASFAATGGGSIGLPTADVARPNGSGAGKTTLYNPSNSDIDFARSSSSLSATETNAGLKQFPFALDTLKMAVSNSTASNAPTSISSADIVKIYKCDTGADTWDEVGGTSTATIAPKIPQAGSGTRSFFEAQLKSLNGGTSVVLGTCVAEVQEHDDTLIKNNPNAIGPFSAGRAALLGTTTRLLDGWQAQRALYNVVRGADLDKAEIQSVFGEDGFVCSTDARSLIEQAGFQQLATPAHGGVCGQATTTATSNFALNQQVVTTTALSGSSTAAGALHLSATVTPLASAAGTVDFFEGDTNIGSAPLVQGAAALDLTGQTPGSHSYTAKFVPDTSTVDPSQASTEVVVKSASSMVLSFSAAPTYGKALTVTATATGIADGQLVSVKVGTLVKSASVTSGVAKAVFTTHKAGSFTVTATYAGSTTVAKSTASKAIVIAKAAPVITESFPDATAAGYPGKGTVKVAISGSTLKPTGTVAVYKGTKLLKSATLSSTTGAVTITLPKLTKGKHLLTVKYLGSANVKAGAKSFYLTQR